MILGFGLLFHYVRHIDVSVDGIVILAGIASAVSWNATESISLSLLAGLSMGAALSAFCAVLHGVLGVSTLMTGIIFSLVAHAVSIQWVGESLRVRDTNLITGMRIPIWLPIVGLTCCIASYFAAKTRTGIMIRKLGDGVVVNTGRTPILLLITAYSFAGLLYGLTAALYIHKTGSARSGGSFDVLVIALCAFMSVSRLLVLIQSALLPSVARAGDAKYSKIGDILISPQAAALGGALFYGILVHMVIAYAPDQRLWKVVLAGSLLVAVIDFGVVFPRRCSTSAGPMEANITGTNGFNANGLRIEYRDGAIRRSVLEDASATFLTGLTVIIGPNGSGKSTLLKALAGMLRLDSGNISLNGRRIDRLRPSARSQFFVTQDAKQTLGESLSVGEVLDIAAPRQAQDESPDFGGKEALLVKLDSYGIDIEQLRGTGFDPSSDMFWNQRVSMLSGGQATITAIYAAMLSCAEVILLDEPTNGLDTTHFQVVSELIQAAAKQHCVIAATHDDRLRAIAETVLALRNGKLEAIPEPYLHD